MLLYLAEYRSQYHRGLNFFQYLPPRAILGVLVALVPWQLLQARLPFHCGFEPPILLPG